LHASDRSPWSIIENNCSQFWLVLSQKRCQFIKSYFHVQQIIFCNKPLLRSWCPCLLYCLLNSAQSIELVLRTHCFQFHYISVMHFFFKIKSNPRKFVSMDREHGCHRHLKTFSIQTTFHSGRENCPNYPSFEMTQAITTMTILTLFYLLTYLQGYSN